MSARRILAVLASLLTVLAVFVAGVVVGGHAEATGLTRLSDPWRSLVLGDSGQDLPSQVLDILEDDYYEPVDTGGLERASADAIVKALDDPYTTYLDPDELRALRAHTEGAYFGVGLQVAQRDEAILVTRVFPGSPASRTDVRAGDRLVSVDGEPVGDRTLDAVVSRIRGPEGTTVRVGVATGRQPPRVLRLERARVRVPAVEARTETVAGTEVGYVALFQFTRGAADDLRAAVRDLREEGAEALVLDLRGDPGGLVSEAVGVAGAFLPDDSVVVRTEGENSPARTFRTDGAPVAGDLPLIVLINRGSASASEIVAGALRDADRGRLVGQRTFGKALVQSTVPLRDGGALKLTTARYLTPSGFDLAERGLPPEVKVVDDPETEPDEALDRALELAAAAG